MMDFINQLPVIHTVYKEAVVLDQPFEKIASCFADDSGTVLLLSGSDLDCSQYHILAVDPWLEIVSKGDTVQVDSQGKKSVFECDIFDFLQTLQNRFRQVEDPDGLPITSGLFGYLSYDLKDRIETLPNTCLDSGLPDLCLFSPSVILIQDKLSESATLCIPCFDFGSGTALDHGRSYIDQRKNWFFSKTAGEPQRDSFSIDNQGFVSSFSKVEYVDAVNKIIKYLKAGDIYQANLSQQFKAGFNGDAYALFLDLFKRNPASFFSYVKAADHVIVSTSPERFVQQTGTRVETRPIKGTIARGKDPLTDEKNGIALSNSIKDDAELTMIVDLMRNDLSRVTRYGTVEVTEHKRLEPYENVFHLVSIVQGELLPDKTSIDLIRATFPGGSITGCPKIRSMEIIDELEPVKRHVYTGSIGYVSFHDTMDLSIAIRTATVHNNTIVFSVGGGIVYDSDPYKEYQETLDKGKTLLDSLSGTARRKAKPYSIAWVNGKLVPQYHAVINAGCTGFQYGAGVFETLKVENHRIYFLEDHVTRMNRAYETLFSMAAPSIIWADVINALLRENAFKGQSLAVKLMLAEDETAHTGMAFAAAFVRPYAHRLEVLKKDGLDIITYPHPRVSPLADFKTLNYLYYDSARRFAVKKGADEALILNADLSVSETNTANLFAVDKDRVVVPKSVHVLGGVTQSKILSILAEKGYTIETISIDTKQLAGLPNVLVSNSLMGVVKVCSIDGKPIHHDTGLAAGLNDRLFN